jgi:hypothetical protein
LWAGECASSDWSNRVDMVRPGDTTPPSLPSSPNHSSTEPVEVTELFLECRESLLPPPPPPRRLGLNSSEEPVMRSSKSTSSSSLSAAAAAAAALALDRPNPYCPDILRSPMRRVGGEGGWSGWSGGAPSCARGSSDETSCAAGSSNPKAPEDRRPARNPVGGPAQSHTNLNSPQRK